MDPPEEIIWLAAVHPHRYQSTSLNLWRSIGNIKFYYFSWGQLHLGVTWGEHFLVARSWRSQHSGYSGSDHFSRGERQYFISVCCCEAPCWHPDISWNLRTKSWVLIFSCRLWCRSLHCLLSYHCTWLQRCTHRAIFILVCSQFPSAGIGRPGLGLPSLSPRGNVFLGLGSHLLTSDSGFKFLTNTFHTSYF